MRYYFIPHGGRFYVVIASLGSVYRYLLTFFLVSFLLYVWWFALYSNVEALIKKNYIEIAVLEKKQQFFASADIECMRLNGLINDLSAQLRMSNTQTNGSYDFLMALFTHAQKTGLSVLACTPERQKDLLWSLRDTYVLELCGGFMPMVSFLQSLDMYGRVLGSKDVRFIRENEHIFKIVCSLDSYALKESV